MTFLLLFFEFFKAGLFAVGGGLATIPFLYQISDKYGWFTHEVLVNMIAVSESTPGPIGINMATYSGFMTEGLLGGVVATIGVIAPSFIIGIIAIRLMEKYSQNIYLKSAFKAIRATVTGLILAIGYGIVKNCVYTERLNVLAVIMFLTLLFAMRKFKIHPIIYIILSAIVGIFISL